MRRTEPPAAATWLLKHLTPGPRNDALAGDLLEEFCSGRPPGWYWRQVLCAITIGCIREYASHQAVILFAVTWSMLAPAWLLIVTNLDEYFKLNESIGQMDWPLSTICDIGLLLAANVLFIWTGIVLYLIPHLWVTKTLKAQPLSRGVLASLPVLLALCAALIVLPKYFLGSRTVYRLAVTLPQTTLPIEHPALTAPGGVVGQGVDRLSISPFRGFLIDHPPPTEAGRIHQHEEWIATHRDMLIYSYNGPRSEITDMRTPAIVVRLPFFLAVLCALWETVSRSNNRNKRIAA